MGSNKLYLSGPMTGIKNLNRPVFNSVAQELRNLGWFVYNPAEYDYEGDFPARQAFAEYSNFICLEADIIVMLPGWETSTGARAEHALATACGVRIAYTIAMTPARSRGDRMQ